MRDTIMSAQTRQRMLQAPAVGTDQSTAPANGRRPYRVRSSSRISPRSGFFSVCASSMRRYTDRPQCAYPRQQLLATEQHPHITADRERVRQAIAYAIDKQTIIKNILKGTGIPATGPVPSVVESAYKKDVRTYNFDPDKARQLLKEAGFADGFKAKFWVPQSGSGMQSPKPMAEAAQAMLGQVGINLEIQVLEWGAYLDLYAKGMPDDVAVAEMSWFTQDAQNIPNLTLTCTGVSPKGYNAGYYCNPRVDDLLKTYYATLEKQKQAKLMYELQDIVADQVPNVYIDTQLATGALSAKFAGFSLHPSQLLRFWRTHMA